MLREYLKSMIHQYLKSMKPIFILSALLMFVGFALMPIYGWLRPWPEAESAVRKHGIAGTLFMIGCGGEFWSDEQQRSFLAVPESFRAGELFTYIEIRRSRMAKAQSEVVQGKVLPLWGGTVFAGGSFRLFSVVG